MEEYIMALDQGTTSSRCILFNHKGEIKSIAQKEFTQYYPQPGWVEHDPMEIWSSQLSVAIEAMSKIQAKGGQIKGIGITNQRETTILWDKLTGNPVCPAIVWQCRRTSDIVEKLKSDDKGDMILKKTGLILDAYFSATKISWILEYIPQARELANQHRLLFGTVDTWLIYQLTGGKVHVTDVTNASRTMLYNIHELCWDKDICQLLNIPMDILPKVCQSSEIYGYTNCVGLPENIPISGAAGDQQAALFGQCCFEPGDTKNTYGTGCFLLMNTGKQAITSQHGLITTIACGIDGEISYALEGSVFIAGAAIKWLRDELQIIRSAAETEEIANSVDSTLGAYVVPAFTGLGAPYWDQYARGSIVGLTRGFGKAHLVRAVLESIAYETYDILKAMEEDSQKSICTLKVDGGASVNHFLTQFQADILQSQVILPSCTETTALGAAYLAGLAVGFWKDKQEIKNNWSIKEAYHPSMPQQKQTALLAGWHKAVKCSFGWVEKTALVD